MLTIDEYIAKMKRAEKLDEFDFTKNTENMTAVVKYVMSYFNEYLCMETCDAEVIKLKHITEKLEEEIGKKYPQSKDFVLNFYLQYRIRIHKELDKRIQNELYFPFYYTEQDFSSLAEDFCNKYKIIDTDMNKYRKDIAILISEIKKCNTDVPHVSEMIRLDNRIVSWVRETYREYGVNLYAFAYDLSNSYYERYVKYKRGDYGRQIFQVNNYNHRYNANPFEIDRIYEDNKHRPFLENKCGELEMIVMHEWLFNCIYDDDYWSEYVNLCVSRGRVSIVKNVNVLIPVTIGALEYPTDVPCSTEHIVSTDGVIKRSPKDAYILRLDVTQMHAGVWQNTEEMTALIEKMNSSFREYSAPQILEISAPIKTASFDEENFFSCCALLERRMKKYSPMKVAILNGSGNPRSKPISCLYTIEDIIRLKAQLRERNMHMQFSIDFTALLASKKDSNYDQNGIFGELTEIKNSIACLNINNVKPQVGNFLKIRTINDDTDVNYLNKYKYPTYDDFYSMLSSTFNDNQQRYLIPKNITNNSELETLVDNLLRSGFAFSDGGKQNE